MSLSAYPNLVAYIDRLASRDTCPLPYKQGWEEYTKVHGVSRGPAQAAAGGAGLFGKLFNKN